MKIGLLVDGKAEFYGLPHLLPRLGSPHVILSPLLCDIQPYASPAQIALAASKRFAILLPKGVTLIVILLDKERRQECTGELVLAIEREARARLAALKSPAAVRVVFKVPMFENWLVADPEALRGMIGRFEKVERIAKQAAPNRADAVDALGLLKTCSKDRTFDKVRDGVAICKVLEPARAAANSRSFRKLLKELGVAEDPARGVRKQRR
jgi:hypothetical protein